MVQWQWIGHLIITTIINQNNAIKNKKIKYTVWQKYEDYNRIKPI
jgi:hypothetical protein